MKKGIAPLTLALLILVFLAMFAILGYLFYLVVVPPPVVVAYTGEFDDLFLPTKGWFSTELSVDTVKIYDENITATLDTTRTLNVTASPDLIGDELEWSWVIEVDGPVKISLEGELVAAVEDKLHLVSFEVWTHEDVPTLITSIPIEDMKEVDAIYVIGTAGEYAHVLTAKPRSGLNLAAGDDIIVFTYELMDRAPEAGDREAISQTIESG